MSLANYQSISAADFLNGGNPTLQTTFVAVNTGVTEAAQSSEIMASPAVGFTGWEAAKALFMAIIALIMGIVVYEFQGVKNDVSDIKKEIVSNNISLIEKADDIDKKIAVTNTKLDDLKAVLKK